MVYRCWIPECESSDSRSFHANWTEYAIPLKDGVLDSCSRYAYISTDIKGLCGEQNFNRSQMIDCDGYIIKGGEERLVSHVSLLNISYIPSVQVERNPSVVFKQWN